LRRLITMKLSAILALPLLQLPLSQAYVGGRCAGTWGPQCICLDWRECESRGGHSAEGTPGDYPCPSDPNNVMGCFLQDCAAGNTYCTWREGCTGSILSGELGVNFNDCPPIWCLVSAGGI
jgi:hypothetical protein